MKFPTYFFGYTQVTNTGEKGEWMKETKNEEWRLGSDRQRGLVWLGRIGQLANKSANGWTDQQIHPLSLKSMRIRQKFYFKVHLRFNDPDMRRNFFPRKIHFLKM